MNCFYNDENNRLTDEIRGLMEKAAAEALSREFGTGTEDADAEIGVTVVSGQEIRELNRDYRGNDSITDVLSFPQYDDIEELEADLSEGDGAVLLGDIVICYDRVLSQAEEFGTGITREFVYLFTHSMLHLLGYDHMEDDEKREMRGREEEIMQAIGVTR